jgi:hypothetical protein
MAKPGEIVSVVNELLPNYTMRVTLRQVYYRLVALQVILNNLNSYKRLSKILTVARENGNVDPAKFEDRRRYTEGGYTGYLNIDDFLKIKKEEFLYSWQHYQRKPWQGQKDYVEIWVEKDALASQLIEVADQFGVLVAVTSGYSSYTFLQDAVVRITDAVDQGRHPSLLCFCDFDPSGEDMVRDLGARLERYGIDDATDIIHKVALTREQIDEYQLPPNPTKITDGRRGKFIAEHGDECVELDALDPPVLQSLVRRSITRHIDAGIWNPLQEISEKEKTEVMNRFARVAHYVEVM